MANLTLSIDEKILKQARIKALQEDSSVNALVRDYLVAYTQSENPEEILNELFRLANRNSIKRGKQTWSREDLHER